MNTKDLIKLRSSQLLEAKEQRRIDRRAEQAEAREKERIAIEAFHQKLARNYGLENHPKEPKLWALAWEHGHSAGYGEVRGYYHDFSELLT